MLKNEVDPKLEKKARREHDEAKSLTAAIEGITPEDPELERLVSELKATVEHHVYEEETEIFPKLRQELAPKLVELGEVLTKRKQDLGGVDPGRATDMPPMGA